jgi:hypothetical protein
MAKDGNTTGNSAFVQAGATLFVDTLVVHQRVVLIIPAIANPVRYPK